MRVLQVQPLTLTISLNPMECLAVSRAIEEAITGNIDNDRELLEALMGAFMVGGFAAYAVSSHDKPTTLPNCWEWWGPCDSSSRDRHQAAMPEYFTREPGDTTKGIRG